MSAGNGPLRRDSSLHVPPRPANPVTAIGILDDTKPFTSFVNNKADKYRLHGLFCETLNLHFFTSV